jgi:hypothetical protein
MSRIRPAHKTVIVAALVAGLLFADALRSAPAAADTETDVIIGVSAFVGYMALVGGLTWLIYSQREEEEKPPQPRRDPYSFTSNQVPRPPSDGLQFGTTCAAHGPGALFCW